MWICTICSFRWNFDYLKKIPGLKQCNQLISMMIKSDCGKNLVLESLEEVGVIQYLEKARLGQLDLLVINNQTTVRQIQEDRQYENQQFRKDIK